MNKKELIDYLNTFPEDAKISVIIANTKERKLYEIVDYFGITDAENPAFFIDIGKSTDMDSDVDKAEEIKGQMQITDFPEVMP